MKKKKKPINMCCNYNCLVLKLPPGIGVVFANYIMDIMGLVMKHRIQKFFSGALLLCICSASSAALLDFTDSSVGLSGTIDGVGYDLTSNGTINTLESYDGNGVGCISSAGVLACENDGVGINGGDNDEVDTGEALTLTFDSVVKIDGFYFLDLFQVEQVKLEYSGNTLYINAGEPPYDNGGYLAYLLGNPIFAKEVVFQADDLFGDNGDNNYALAGVSVSAVPLPAAVWLFGSALLGLIGFSRKSA